jgi:DnaK suppressor protein
MDSSEATQLLGAERTRIEEALAGLDTAARESREDPVHDHPEAAESFDASRDAGLRGQLEDDLAAVERAEQRLADGTYGQSVESGDAIPDDRLRAQPTAERTVDEQQRRGG